MKKNILAKKTSKESNEMRREYDFSGGVRGKYAKTLRENGYIIRIYNDDNTFVETRVLGAKTVILDPDVYEYFPSSQDVNKALRMLISLVPEKRKESQKK
jgi:hypothetical protein